MYDELKSRLISAGVVSKEPVRLSHAGYSDIYIDIRKAIGDPAIRYLIAYNLSYLIDKSTTCIAASGYGGIPIANEISQRKGIMLTMVREQPKNYGKMNLIEGYVPGIEDKVTIVDDVLTSGKTIKSIINAIKQTNASILGCCVVVKRGNHNLDIPVRHLLTLEDLI